MQNTHFVSQEKPVWQYCTIPVLLKISILSTRDLGLALHEHHSKEQEGNLH